MGLGSFVLLFVIFFHISESGDPEGRSEHLEELELLLHAPEEGVFQHALR